MDEDIKRVKNRDAFPPSEEIGYSDFYTDHSNVEYEFNYPATTVIFAIAAIVLIIIIGHTRVGQMCICAAIFFGLMAIANRNN